MKKCKYCGKEFESTPVYCIHCGASNNFLIKKTDEVINKYSEKNNIENYYEPIKKFSGDKDKYIKNDKWAIPRDELNQIKKALDNEYYSFIKKKLGNKPVNSRIKDEYYSDLKDILEDPLRSIEETTFNGIFDKEDTIENTFFKSKEKKRTGASNRNKKSQKKKWFESRKKDDHIEITARTKKNKKISDKLWRMIFGLITLLTLLLIVMFTLIDNIVNVNDIEAPLPTESVALSLFSEIKNTDEASFMKNPQGLYISNGMDISDNINQAHLKTLFDLVGSKDYEIKSVKKIEAKGALRAVVTYEVIGESLPAKVFESLIFRDVGNGNFKLDLEEFIFRYNRFNNISKINDT